VIFLGSKQIRRFDEMNDGYRQLSNDNIGYWVDYSNLATWQFWFLLAMLLLPLVALYLFIDRKKALLIGFYGFNVHVWFHYIDTYGATNKLWSYPYKVIPNLPFSVALDTSFVPITYMLLYQWTVNKTKNYYLYATLWSACLAFILKPALTTFGLFRMYDGMNYFFLFLGYVVVMLVSKWITNLFNRFQKQQGTLAEQEQHFGGLFSNQEKAK
jgi:hypothetical protein